MSPMLLRGLIAGRSRGRRSLDLNTRSHASLPYSTNTLRLPTDPLFPADPLVYRGACAGMVRVHPRGDRGAGALCTVAVVIPIVPLAVPFGHRPPRCSHRRALVPWRACSATAASIRSGSGSTFGRRWPSYASHTAAGSVGFERSPFDACSTRSLADFRATSSARVPVATAS
jgi:hypothetical protein